MKKAFCHIFQVMQKSVFQPLFILKKRTIYKIFKKNMGYKIRGENSRKHASTINKLPSVQKSQECLDEFFVPFSTSVISKRQKERQENINKNVKKHLKRISKRSNKGNTHKRLLSVLYLQSEQSIPPSAFNIPSIQNMVSYRQLKDTKDNYSIDSGSLLSFNQCISYRVLESQPQLMLTYMILVERALTNLGLSLSARQNQKIIKGVWNLVAKYWKDSNDQNQYKYISEKIQWGLFELLNFDLTASPQERMLMEIKINSLEHIDF